MAKKLIFMIPTGGKTLEEMQQTVKDMWPEIQKKIDAEKPPKKGILSNLYDIFLKRK